MYIVITGASKGIGLELTRQGLKKGHHVLAVVRNFSLADELQSLRKEFKALEILDIDLKASDAQDEIAAKVSSWPCVDALINNAGIYLDDTSISNFEESFLVNTVKPFFITQALMPSLKKSERPVSLQITSQMGSIEDNSSGGSHSYRASKAALNMIFKGISIEENWLISLNVHPGWVKTRMGGLNAPVSPHDSAAGIWKILESAKKSDSGSFVNYLGKKLPW